MRVFVVLCLVAAACAQSGYNYQPEAHGSDSQQTYATPETVSDYAADSNSAPSYAAPQGDLAQGTQDSTAYAPQAELEKEFYSYSANEEDFTDPAASNQIANSVKQGLRVVFIKGPENKGLEDAALALAKQAADQKTDIYVLNKQADIGDLANKLNAINKNNNNKPDVHFVKYRTPEDAANAQRTIQNQYDSLGGRSQSHDGGVAPVLNFASQAPVAHREAAASSPSSSYIPPAAASSPSTSYLPASIIRRFRL